jgi:hypothetical protein
VSAEDVAFWLGRVLKGVGAVVGSGAEMTLVALIKAVVPVTAIVAATHASNIVGKALDEAVNKHVAQLESDLKAAGIDVTRNEAEKILRGLYEDAGAPQHLKELEDSLKNILPALETIGAALTPGTKI